MVELKIKNNTGKPYSEVRDMICKSLVGNRGFIEDDIIVSDAYEKENTICIVLGDGHNKLIVNTLCSMDYIQGRDV